MLFEFTLEEIPGFFEPSPPSRLPFLIFGRAESMRRLSIHKFRKQEYHENVVPLSDRSEEWWSPLTKGGNISGSHEFKGLIGFHRQTVIIFIRFN